MLQNLEMIIESIMGPGLNPNAISQIHKVIKKSPLLSYFLGNPELIIKSAAAQSKDGWQKRIICECFEPLVALSGFENGKPIQIHEKIVPEPVYYNNGISGALPIIYVREAVAKALLNFIKLLPPRYGIIVYDGYRPIAVQQALFDDFYAKLADKEENKNLSTKELTELTSCYVSVPSLNPKCPSTHNTGGAIDFGIYDFKIKSVINYGCEFDDFTQIANLEYYENTLKKGEALTDEQIEFLLHVRLTANLATYKTVGLASYLWERWHFDINNQWDDKATVVKYGSCDLAEISPDPHHTILGL